MINGENLWDGIKATYSIMKLKLTLSNAQSIILSDELMLTSRIFEPQDMSYIEIKIYNLDSLAVIFETTIERNSFFFSNPNLYFKRENQYKILDI